MSTYHNPFAARSHLQSTHPYEPLHSVLHSRAFTELQLAKPSQLINDNPHDSSLSGLELPENPFISYASFGMYESRASPAPLKENPFMAATPFRFHYKEPVKEKGKGLSAWEKQKYLKMYAERQGEEETNTKT